VEFDDLVNMDVYLVKKNRSASTVSAADTGSAPSSSLASALQTRFDEVVPPLSDDDALMMDSPAVLAWEPSEALWKAERERNDAARSVGGPARLVVYTVGTSTKSFWLQSDSTYPNNPWTLMPATLRAQGTYCNVWVTDADYDNTAPAGNPNGKVNSAQAEILKTKFDIIYPLETSLLGYEFGGGLPASDPNYGGRDGDPRVQILVYKDGMAGLGGYFWKKDYFLQEDLDKDPPPIPKTNYAEIFYLNSVLLNEDPDYTYSTMAHEFQHMINFNVKYVRQGLKSETWYDEMLSMLAEDVLDSFIDVAPEHTGHPIKDRIPRFLATFNNYSLGGTWGGNAVAYANTYAFGAYLVRNYGGLPLLQKMLANNSVNIASISAALAELNTDMDFNHALDRYGEALVFSGSVPGAISFNHAVTETVNGKTYTFSAIDIWNMGRNPLSGSSVPQDKGPWPDNTQKDMPEHSVQLQFIATGKSGDFSVTLNKPNNPYVDFYVMTRPAAAP
jgi:hypothetical protein